MIQNKISALKLLAVAHIFFITISNILVQYPFEIFGFHTTWGAFTYPFIFILTDLTTRLSNARTARRIVLLSMLPGLLISYFIASSIEILGALSWNSFFAIHYLPLRIALGCFVAYVIGQFMDIFIFQRIRTSSSWWVAPALSTTIGNIIDTLLFFTIAFYHSTHPFLSQHWPEIALVDVCFKITISLMAFVPIYGCVLHLFKSKYRNAVIDQFQF
ncbi:7-cyano-7-deazaguanine/7-aminomethyl-7-deazaguanine transporter [Legionella longbeachae]|uniref:Probable queuosine precursor transporter n=1 Tax=Legionella longbeachae serogroup 1 (strain NSW150) TaxID=661367 RepID=D3HM56_LEGLN|nr:7-cyano-7-deazaguanine/7-aminomethyl-7-deazaguanine transporter [Legionella longbeachae]ARB93175.1 7-cyano-7-deazaguanine/7-aminomethyl-7-deazaguanine transporter [Legionella longbeachae]ARM33761.1 7-cyano-7-deazaguanine/7-aminomethyl-7-deazaguanine transporter [Legionella longbeachae]EEZ97079.1 inner membrane protein YhhQ [Legionella longbeachae D-4968]QIN33628.1 7-cyano-7-deazaguanine/7-aminomethyl-7-deazaguanine transporter [Legionella longbeachae]QIN36980.1 7-cyano-7-deazaguanine/7-amin